MKREAVNTNENPWTAAEDEMVARLRVAGMTWAEVAEAVGRTTIAAQSRYYMLQKAAPRHAAPGDLYGMWEEACKAAWARRGA